jgi:hypothetical protein
LIAPDNLRPRLLPALIENPSVPESQLAKVAISASRESIDVMLQSPRVRVSVGILDSLRSNPYLKTEEASIVTKLLSATGPQLAPAVSTSSTSRSGDAAPIIETTASDGAEKLPDEGGEVSDETVSSYLTEHAPEIVAAQDKPFQPVGGAVDLLSSDHLPMPEAKQTTEIIGAQDHATAPASSNSTIAATPAASRPAPVEVKRANSMQKINSLDVKGRIQLALKGNKEERSILIRDGTKVVALAVLEAPKISDGEVEKFALQKNVLEAVLRQIPLKRRFMKNYIVVRNLVANPRTPLDLGLGLMKHLLVQDLKNISANKEISETVRKLALKMYKQKLDAANKK